MKLLCRYWIFAGVILGIITNAPISAFTLPSCSTISSTRLFYKNYDKNLPPSTRQRRAKLRVMTIPVLGPIPGGQPLLIGEDYVIEHPTPMQWDILQEAFFNHQNHLKNQAIEESEGESLSGGPASIDAAPLVAFIDETTSLTSLEGNFKNSKYATIAAIVGLGGLNKNTKAIESMNHLDTTSNARFMESMIRIFRPDVDCNHQLRNPLESNIRLVGIGRAALSEFHSRLPSSHYEEHEDDDGYITLLGQPTDSEATWEPQQSEVEAPTPILLAQFRLLSDTGARSKNFVNTFGRSQYASPIHALNEMNCLFNRITMLHEDSKRLVRGIHAAKARLAGATSSFVLEDVDGLGMVSNGSKQQHRHDIEALLHDFPEDREIKRRSFLSSSLGADNHAKVLDRSNNYGMGITSASFSQIPNLTRELAEKLQPYYSPEKQESEEFYYEVFSFMGVLSLSKFVSVTDFDWALKCTNTIERLRWVSDWMRSHKRILQDASKEASLKLRECGEECTDLW